MTSFPRLLKIKYRLLDFCRKPKSYENKFWTETFRRKQNFAEIFESPGIFFSGIEFVDFFQVVIFLEVKLCNLLLRRGSQWWLPRGRAQVSSSSGCGFKSLQEQPISFLFRFLVSFNSRGSLSSPSRMIISICDGKSHLNACLSAWGETCKYLFKTCWQYGPAGFKPFFPVLWCHAVFFVLSPSALTPSKLERQVLRARFLGSILIFTSSQMRESNPGWMGE